MKYEIYRNGEYTGVSFKTKKSAERYCESMAKSYPEYVWTFQTFSA